MMIDYNLLAGRARIDLKKVDAALNALIHGDAVWTVVGGKMCSGKDTIAPAVRESLLADSPVCMLRYGNLMRADLDPGTEILRADAAADIDPAVTASRIAAAMGLAPAYATELVAILRPEMIASEFTLDPHSRTDGIRTVLQNLGDHWRCENDEDYWARLAAHAALDEISEGRSVILTGGRFLPDVDLPRAAGSILVRLDVTRETQLRRLAGRDGLAPSPETLAALDHVSETTLDDYPHFDVRVDNDVDGEDELAAVLATVNETIADICASRSLAAA